MSSDTVLYQPFAWRLSSTARLWPDFFAYIFCRLHDLRDPAAYIASWTDTVDQFSSIYSLLPLGFGRFLAGSSNHSLLKVFDMRKLDGTQCRCGSLDHTSLQTQCNTADGSSPNQSRDKSRAEPRSWNVFLTDISSNPNTRGNLQSMPISPVYSLSSPSACSPTIFAGIEGQVIQLDITSVYDRFPDPIYNLGPMPARQNNTPRNFLKAVASKWDPHAEVLCLAMYDQVVGQPILKHQAAIGKPGDEIPGLDERWKHV